MVWPASSSEIIFERHDRRRAKTACSLCAALGSRGRYHTSEVPLPRERVLLIPPPLPLLVIVSNTTIGDGQQSRMFPLLAGVLAAGNVCFDDHGDGNAATVLQTPDNALARAAACLGVDSAALEAALTSVTLLVGRAGVGGGGGGGGRGGRSGSRDASSWIGAGSSVRGGREKEAFFFVLFLFSFFCFVVSWALSVYGVCCSWERGGSADRGV